MATRTQSTVLITGASSGIGYELAHVFAEHGHNLVLTARSGGKLRDFAARLEDVYQVEARALAIDLEVPRAAKELTAELRQNGVQVDILVNCAGFAIQGPFVENDVQAVLGLLQLNIVALTHLTRLLLPRMVEQGYGRVLNVASMAAYMPGPLMAAYFASKSYVLSFSEALAQELRGTGVTVTALCPGPTRTRFEVRAGLSASKAFRGNIMDPKFVAATGYDALMEGRTVYIPAWKHRLQLMPALFMPRSLLAYFARRYHEVNPRTPHLAVHQR